jgi:hypothetical protein
MHTIGCVCLIRSTDQWIDLPPRIHRRLQYCLRPANHNNNTQRVDNTTRLLIGLRDRLSPILSNRASWCYPSNGTRVYLCGEA